MRKKIVVIALLPSLAFAYSVPAVASGDKNRGDVGQGSVVQQHVNWHRYEWRP